MKLSRPFKRVLLASDFHCGHPHGLHMPDDQHIHNRHPDKARIRNLQRECWKFFAESIAEEQPIDVAIWNGDLIDGRQEKQGGNELITADRHIQATYAASIIEHVDAPKNYIVRGTDYHVGQCESFEDSIASSTGASIHDKLWLDVNGVVISARHHIGSGTAAQGRATPLLRDMLWNAINAAIDAEPSADILVRSHVHYRLIVHGEKTGIITPALQARGGRYGDTRLSGTVHFGFIILDIIDPETWRKAPCLRQHVATLQHQKPVVLKV
jgi:hypothetical protein